MKLKRAFHNETEILVPGANFWRAVLDESSIIVMRATGSDGSTIQLDGEHMAFVEAGQAHEIKTWRPSREHKP